MMQIKKVNVINTKLLTIILLLFVSTTNAKSLKVGVIEYPPHTSVEKRNIRGPAIEYLKTALAEEFDDISFTYLPTKRGTVELNKGNIDLLFPIAKSKDIERYLPKSLFHSVPGLCFNKKNYIPILSSTDKLSRLLIAVPAGVELPKALTQSKATLKVIEGSDVLSRGISLLLRERVDSLYHPSPINIYHHTNPLSKKLACSYFHGYSTGLFIATSQQLSKEKQNITEQAFRNAMLKETYEYYFARNGNN